MFSIWIYSIPLLVTLCVPGTYLDSSGVKKFQGTDQLKVSQRLCGTQCFLSFNPLLYTWCRLRAHHLGGTLRGLGWPCWMATWNPVRGSFAGIFAKSLSWTRQWATGRFSTGIPYLLTSGWTRHFLRYSFTYMVATTWLFPIHGMTPWTTSRTSWLTWLFLVQVGTPRLYYLGWAFLHSSQSLPCVLSKSSEVSLRSLSAIFRSRKTLRWSTEGPRWSLGVLGHISRGNWSTKRPQKPHKRPQKSTNDRKFKIGTFQGNLFGKLLD